MTMEHVLGVFAVWLVWQVAEVWLESPRWSWYLIAAGLGIGWELLIDPSQWWLGVGIGGAAAVLTLVADLILVAGDAAKVTVLRNRNR